MPEREEHDSAILRRPAPGLPGHIDTQWWHGLPEEQRAGFFEAVAAASSVRRVGAPADVAAAIVYLAGAGFVTGTVLECAGGADLTVGAMAG